MDKIRGLLFCRLNSGRSQITEAIFNEYVSEKIQAESAGLELKELNPLVVRVMQEGDFDISNKQTNSLFE
jgi:arsenate reductase